MNPSTVMSYVPPTSRVEAAGPGTRVPSEHVRHAMKPSRFVLFMRTFFLYQLWRFFWINVRMLKMISLSHR